MIDGEPRLSCLCLAGQVSGSEITTVEGLAEGLIWPQFKPVLQNMAVHNAVSVHRVS